MNLSRDQRIFLLTARQRNGQPGLWHGACRSQHWNPTDREFRLAKLSEILGRIIQSTDDIERVDEFTKIKNELLVLQGVSLKAAHETVDPTLNQARVIRHFILTDLVPCLELYLDDVRGYMTAIMEDKNRWWKIDRPACDITLMDLDAKPVHRWDVKRKEMRDFPSQLEQIKWTLAARLNSLRNDAGDTIHTMRLRAGLDCTCAVCRGVRVALSLGDPELEALAGADPDPGAAVPEEADCPY